MPSTSPPGGPNCRPSGARATSASAPLSTSPAAPSRCPCGASTDNGGEFLNHILVPWCREEGIRFTRGRPYRKNDQAYVEQRNGAVLRRYIGYHRYCTRAALLALQAVHEILRLYVNFFQPVRKLVSKERHGARVLKRYDRAQTPYRRLLASGILTPARRDALVAEYQRLNPLQLRAALAVRLDALWKLADRSERSAA